ncbi:amidohydrolase family protein [Wenzhouxiangella sp. EGI_FJ10409]|uniref:amidohydrolase family protein n=1 Tax=Wenzhouxiangella sp. EGI_FJ10409 TaxID=3243767 RepID=UPI0035DF1455
MILVAALFVQAAPRAEEPVLRQAVPGVHALTGVTLVTAPGERVSNGTIVVRDGIIEAVGADVAVPADARVHEFDPEEGEVRVYPGLIDAYVPIAFSGESDGDADEDEETDTLRPGQYPHPLVTPARRLDSKRWPAERIQGLRRAGFTTAAVAPDKGLFRGYSALVNLGEGGLADNLIEPAMFQHLSLGATTSGRQFPNSRMGSVALLRQVMIDAQWQVRARAAWARNPAQPRPTFLEDIEALEPVFDGRRSLVIESSDMLDSLRAARVAGEFELEPWLVGHGREYQRLDSLAETGLGQILPLDFPEPPDVDGSERDISLHELRHWQLAPENPQRVMEAGLPVVFTSHPHGSADAIFANLARAIERGLDPERALAALTTGPAEMLGIGDRAGRLAPGYMANFLVVEEELFVESPALREVWIDGRQHILRELEPPEIEPAGSWDLTLVVTGMGNMDAVLELEGEAPTLSGTLKVMGSSVPLAEARVSGSRLDVRIDGARLGMPGAITFYMDIEDERGRGSGSSPQGEFEVRGRRGSDPDDKEGTA